MTTDSPFAAHRERTRALAERFIGFLGESDEGRASELLEPLRTALERIDTRRFVVAVVGRQNSGKSTLMNALVGEAEPVSPVNALVWTSALSIVRYADRSFARIHIDPSMERPEAEQEQTRFTADDSMLKRARQLFRRLAGRIHARKAAHGASAPEHKTIDVPRTELDAWVTHSGNRNNFKGVVLAEVFSPSPLLQEGMVLVDSPGIGALTENDTRLAGVVADEVDATVMVYTKDANLGREEMDFLVTTLALRKQQEDSGRPLRRRVFLVQNDRAPGPDDDPQVIEEECRKVADQTARHIAEEWKRRQAEDPSHPRGPPPIERIERVNAKRAERAIKAGNTAMLEDSRVPAVRDALLQFYMYGRAQALLADATFELRSGIANAAADVQGRLDLLAAEAEEANRRILEFSEHKSRLKSEEESISEGGIRSSIEQAKASEIARVVAAVERALSRARESIERARGAEVSKVADRVAKRFTDAIHSATLELDKDPGDVERAQEGLLAQLEQFESEAARIVGGESPANDANEKRARARRAALNVDATLGGGFQRAISQFWHWHRFPWASPEKLRETLLEEHDASAKLARSKAQESAEAVVGAHAVTLRDDLLQRRAAVRARADNLEKALRRDAALKGEERRKGRAALEKSKAALADLMAEVEAHLASLEN